MKRTDLQTFWLVWESVLSSLTKIMNPTEVNELLKGVASSRENPEENPGLSLWACKTHDYMDPNCDLMLYCHYTDILHDLSLNLWFVKEVQWNLGACNVVHHFIFTLHVEPLSTEFWWVHDAWSSRLKQVQGRCVRSMTGGGCEGSW